MKKEEQKEKEPQLEYGEVNIKLPFAIGDIVYFMRDSEISRGSILRIELNINSGYNMSEEKTVAEGFCEFEGYSNDKFKKPFTQLFKYESELIRHISINYPKTGFTLFNKVAVSFKEPNKGKPFHKIVSDAQEKDSE